MNDHQSATHLWTINVLAEFMQVKPSAVRRWVYERRIRFFKIGRLIRFHPQILKEDMEQNRIGKVDVSTGLSSNTNSISR
jgi:excisionase family DNA binding protein